MIVEISGVSSVFHCSIHVFASENVQMLSILLNLCINAQVHKYNVCLCENVVIVRTKLI